MNSYGFFNITSGIYDVILGQQSNNTTGGLMSGAALQMQAAQQQSTLFYSSMKKLQELSAKSAAQVAFRKCFVIEDAEDFCGI